MQRGSVAVALVLTVTQAACVHRSPGTLFESPAGRLSESQARLRDELRRDVESLSTTIGPRNAAESLASIHGAERWILGRLEEAGLRGRRDPVDLNGPEAANVEVTFPGVEQPARTVLLGAHYDTVRGSPGANDNASGVALLLATARRLRGDAPGFTVRIVFFVNEEAPFTGGVQMGSKVYAERCRAGGDDIVAMIAVDSIGYYVDDRGSQRYPLLARGAFPSRGNFVAFAGPPESRPLLDRVVAIFQRHSRFPSLGFTLSSKRINRSDHAPFLWQGYPAILMSDTAEARDPTYHLPGDTADRLRYDMMARVAEGFIETVRTLAAPAALAGS